jgi:uncharacterized repeat protein (TIGR01451 family)
VIDHIPAGVSFISANPTDAYLPTQGKWEIGNLSADNNTELEIKVRVNSTNTVTNTANINSEVADDPDSTNNSSSVTINGKPSPDLSISLTDDVEYVYPGFIFTYTVSISNIGNISAPNVIITDVLGTAYTLITDTLGLPRKNPTANKYVWDSIPSISPGESKSFMIRVQTNSSVASTASLINHVLVSTNIPEGNTDNNFADDTNNSVDVNITKSVSPSSVNVQWAAVKK